MLEDFDLGFSSSGGCLGKTAQLWFIYIDIMSIQHKLHTTVQLNDFELRLESLKRSLPLFFYYNMQNYVHYGSYYSELLSSLEANYPGLKDQLSKTGLSIQIQISS